jgi:hypothetical protein
MFRQFMLCWVLLAAFPAKAEIVTRCGASNGMGYRLSNGMIPENEKGWQNEEITEGDMLLEIFSKDKEEQYNILYRDAISWKSQVEDGFSIFAFHDINLLIISINPKTAVLQHYVFELDDKGNGQVAWGTARAGMPFPKSSLMAAKCVAP